PVVFARISVTMIAGSVADAVASARADVDAGAAVEVADAAAGATGSRVATMTVAPKAADRARAERLRGTEDTNGFDGRAGQPDAMVAPPTRDDTFALPGLPPGEHRVNAAAGALRWLGCLWPPPGRGRREPGGGANGCLHRDEAAKCAPSPRATPPFATPPALTTREPRYSRHLPRL